LRKPSLKGRVLGPLAASLFAAVLLTGCSDDKIVFRDRAPFNPPPSEAAGFLGYYDAAAKQTTCGNCHASFQGEWQTTAHADAWATLQASGGAQELCEGCHTVNGNGNLAVGTAGGHDAVKDEVYYDVQCESCHGPGLEHVEGVGQGQLVRPLAKISMDGTGNCGDCHSGSHHPFVEEWEQSGHGDVPARTTGSCVRCHEGRGVLEQNFNVDANFVEKGDTAAPQRITCAVCHDPHGSPNTAQLRFPITSTDPEENLCMQCHLNRAEPNTSSHGMEPHAPQAAVLLGFAGWRPPGFQYDTNRIYGSHATTKNPKLCAGCHVASFTVTDQITGDFVFQATGHLFRPIPCLDAEGKPTADKTCAYTTAERSWKTCTQAGCHADESVAANLFNGARGDLKTRADQLWIDSNGDDVLDAAPTDAGLLATVHQTQPAEFDANDNILSVGEAAEFNARLCGEYPQSNTDNSKGAHNVFLCRALLDATIAYVNTYYFGLPAASVLRPPPLGSLGGAFAGSMHVSGAAPKR
jgi:predicted CXXCH cytochrome family protein